ncbi:putative choline transporter, neither null mutation nor overexpression affects choline transport [Ascosphaera pollenicola]|nr:putative choline transporter, neither null mutation nor overexpression affects choline transport [Ascosphaera pollenicola]
MDGEMHYAPPPGAPPTYGKEGYDFRADPERAAPDYNQTFTEAFKIEEPEYHDVWAGILFVIVFLGYAALSGIVINQYREFHEFNGGGIYNGANNFSLNTNTLILFAFVIASAFAISWLYFCMAMLFSKTFIWVTGIMNVLFGFGTAIYYLKRGQYGGGITLLIFAVLGLLAFIAWIPRIPFSAVMLKTAGHVARHYGHMWLISGIGGIIGMALAAWFSTTLVAIYVAFEPGDAKNPNPSCKTRYGCSSGKVIGCIVAATFAAYWISEWLKYTMYTTTAGVYGSWYFFAGKPSGFPAHATRGALRRATTYSFGSVSFGSLVLALINMLRQLCSIAQDSAKENDNIIAYIFACILGCIVSMLQAMVEFFNRYAYAHIALYGKSYLNAASDTQRMLNDRGFDAVANDCLVGPVISMGAIFVAYICTLLSYLYLQFTKPDYNRDGTFTPLVMAFAFVIGMQVCQIFMTPISSGVDTLFVGMAWDPQVMLYEHPEIAAELAEVYPDLGRRLQSPGER